MDALWLVLQAWGLILLFAVVAFLVTWLAVTFHRTFWVLSVLLLVVFFTAASEVLLGTPFALIVAVGGATVVIAFAIIEWRNPEEADHREVAGLN